MKYFVHSQYHEEKIVNTNRLRLRGAFCVHLLSRRLADNRPLAQSQCLTSVSFAILVYLMCGINKPIQNGQAVNTQGKLHAYRSLYQLQAPRKLIPIISVRSFNSFCEE